jgi:hypothetical protein
MNSIIELLYHQPLGHWQDQTYGPDSVFTKTAKIKNENLDMLMSELTDDQKGWFEKYSQADATLNDIMEFELFSYAFHLGAQMMEELALGKEKLLRE